MKKEISSLIDEVELIHKAIIELLQKKVKSSKQWNENFYGSKIFYSPLIFEPPLLFLGINPGAGHLYDEKEKIINELMPANEFDYCRIESTYSLAKNVYAIFENIGKTDTLKNCMKTNLWYQSTKNVKDLWKLFSECEDLSLYSKGIEWTRRLVSAVRPKAIIFEGFSVCNALFSANEGLVIAKKTKSLIEGQIWKTPFISFKRNFSNISESEKLEEAISKILKVK